MRYKTTPHNDIFPNRKYAPGILAQTGKSTLIKQTFPAETTLFYDLLRSEEYLRLTSQPSLFREEVLSRDKKITHVIVDEIQRIPGLLNEIHFLMEGDNPPHFILSGSSARELKRSQANLLAGRAWTMRLYPFSYLELGKIFSLDKALNIGTLPGIYLCETKNEAARTLKAYVETYLKEEIKEETLVRNFGAFLRFLTLAADENGNIINFSNIARETGTSYHTAKEYFQILEDTLIGFFLFPYSKSVRKRLIKHPKFYFFDTGVQRALNNKISLELVPKTFDYGNSFEHFLITEIIKLSAYQENDYQFSFYRSSNHCEVDLVIETPDKKTFAVEIKSSENPDKSALGGLKSFKTICPKAILYCASRAPRKRAVDDIFILPWQKIFSAVGIKTHPQ